MAAFEHPSEEILVFARQELRAEGRAVARQNRRLHQDVVGPTHSPLDRAPGDVGRSLVEVAPDDPAGRLFVEVPVDRTDHAIHAVPLACLEQGQQPPFARKLVVVEEGEEFAVGAADRGVPRQGDVLARLDTIGHRHRRRRRKLDDQRLGRLQAVVVGDDDRIREPSARLLLPQGLEQPPQQLRALVRADADRDVWHVRTHTRASSVSRRGKSTTRDVRLPALALKRPGARAGWIRNRSAGTPTAESADALTRRRPDSLVTASNAAERRLANQATRELLEQLHVGTAPQTFWRETAVVPIDGHSAAELQRVVDDGAHALPRLGGRTMQMRGIEERGVHHVKRELEQPNRLERFEHLGRARAVADGLVIAARRIVGEARLFEARR